MLDLADQLASLSVQTVYQNSSDALDRIIGDWDKIESCTITPDRTTSTSDGRHVSVEADLVAVRYSGRRFEVRVLVSAEDLDDPHCAPVIEPYGPNASTASETAHPDYATADWKDDESVLTQTQKMVDEAGVTIDCAKIMEDADEVSSAAAIPEFLKAVDRMLREHDLAVLLAPVGSDSYEWRIAPPGKAEEDETFAVDMD